MANETLFWYDLETFGTHPQYDRVAQFAGVRTDLELKVIEDPVLLYCRITDDYLPDPLAVLITGITPQLTVEKGLSEYEFIKTINAEFSRPNTCVAGFNNVKFDDEFIRNLLYRNFYDPYTREYANGNSRWDLIDVLRAAHDLRPDGINWILNEEGRPSFRLEKLTEANGIRHEDAHDAMADVSATIAMASLIKKKQPELYAYAFSLRRKSAVKNRIHLFRKKPILHTAAIHTSEFGCTTMVMPLAVDPNNANSIVCADLCRDPELLISAAPEDLFSSEIPLTRISLNKVPFIAPIGTLTDAAASRLHIDKQLCFSHYDRLQERQDLPVKLRVAMNRHSMKSVDDPDFQIYSGGFFSDRDRERFSQIHETAPETLSSLQLKFDDSRVPEMLWRFTARNFPELLDEETKREWKSFAASRILFPPGDIIINFQFFRRKIDERVAKRETSARDKQILRALADYGDELEKRLFHTEP